jgi:hypothetical protein
VTTPGTSATATLFSGDRCAAPWISRIRAGMPTVVKLKVAFDAIASGGSFASWSAT